MSVPAATLRKTDFEVCGLAGDSIAIREPQLLVTVDFEAFAPEHAGAWRIAMDRWAERAHESGIPVAFFVSIEDFVRVRSSGTSFGDFASGFRALAAAGATFHAHNHGIFDAATGRYLEDVPAEPGAPYAKRRSFFYDVVYRRRENLGRWLTTVRRLHQEHVSPFDCGGGAAEVFRAGGWDYGSTCDDLKLYLGALVEAGFRVDSSACRGTFGSETWRVGAGLGDNVFRLEGGTLEIAPSVSLDCGLEPLTREFAVGASALVRSAWRVRRMGGVLVVVLHFDHLFHERRGNAQVPFSRTADAGIRARVDRLFRLLSFVRVATGLRAVGFEAIFDGARR